MAASGSHSPLYSITPLPDIDPIFLLQWRFLYVKSFVKIIVYVSGHMNTWWGVAR